MRYSQAGPSLARLRIFEPTTSWPARPPARIALSVAGFQNFGQQAAKTMGVFLMKQVHARLGPNPETSCLLVPFFRSSVLLLRLSVPVLRLPVPFLGASAVCSLGFSRARTTRRCAISTISIRSLSSGTWRCR